MEVRRVLWELNHSGWTWLSPVIASSSVSFSTVTPWTSFPILFRNVVSPIRFNFSVTRLSRTGEVTSILRQQWYQSGSSSRTVVAIKKGAFWMGSDTIRSKLVMRGVGRVFLSMHCSFRQQTFGRHSFLIWIKKIIPLSQNQTVCSTNNPAAVSISHSSLVF